MREKDILRNDPQENQGEEVIVTDVLESGEELVQPLLKSVICDGSP